MKRPSQPFNPDRIQNDPQQLFSFPPKGRAIAMDRVLESDATVRRRYSTERGIFADNEVDWLRQGEALANQGRYAEALQHFDRAIALNPEVAEAWVFRGVMLLHLGEYHLALASCDRAIQLVPDNQEAWIFRGVALHRLGSYQSAYASYQRAIGAPHTLWQQVLEQIGHFLLRFLEKVPLVRSIFDFKQRDLDNAWSFRKRDRGKGLMRKP